MSETGTLVALATVFAQLSLLAFGGTNSVIPEMQRQVVDLHGWMGAREFAALFALAQAAPGPNMMVVSLIGWQVAGVAGAVVTTLAVAGPSSFVVWLVAGAWYRFRDTPWRKAVQAGLMPVTAGLVMASAALLIHTTTIDWFTAAITLAAVALFMLTRLHPLLILASAATLGALGGIG
ncbi:MAG: chromate transporter [Acetobacteraceae bacterium]